MQNRRLFAAVIAVFLALPLCLRASVNTQYQPVAGHLTYRVIDGGLAKKIDSLCAGLWFDNDEVLLLEYKSHTYLIRVNNPGSVGLACKPMI